MDFLFGFADYLNFIDEEYYQELIKNRKILKKIIWQQLKNHDFEETRFYRVILAQLIGYLKSFYKMNLDINQPLRL